MLKVFVRDKRVVVLVFVVAVVIVCFRFGCVKVQEACMGGARCQGKREIFWGVSWVGLVGSR